MPIITLLTDFGNHGYYVASLKSALLKACSTATIIDISHQVRNGNIAQGGFLLRSIYRDFPEGTVHLVGVGSASQSNRRFIALQSGGHFFVGPDNGVLTLHRDLLDEGVKAVLLPHATEKTATFPSKYILAPAAGALAHGKELQSIGDHTNHWVKKRFPALKIEQDQIKGQVIFIDTYGNLITNIGIEDFEETRKGRSYQVRCGYERFSQISTYYNSKEFGDCVLLFNSLGLLEIAINQGNANELLGMGYQSPVLINFEATSESL